MNQKKKYLTVQQLEEYYHDTEYNCIRWIFKDCNMFRDAYMHFKTMDSTGIEKDEIYYIGINCADLADIFASKYEHRLVERPINLDDPTADVERIKRRLHAMVCEYIPKYLKTVETYGYTYNPLANVDADEQYAYIDSASDTNSNGSTDSSSENSSSSHSSTNVNTTSTSINGGEGISSPETHLYETQYDDTGKSDANLKSYTTTSGGSTSHSTANANENYSDGSADSSSSGSASSSSESHYDRQNINVKASDNALGFNMDSATNIHIEKHRRVGNIGTTKTTELIQSEREIYSSIIHEFLEDAAKEILLPLYNFDD